MKYKLFPSHDRFKTTICSDPDKLLGAGFSAVKVVIVFVCNVDPSSTLAYLDGLWATACISYSSWFTSLTEKTLKVWSDKDVFSITHTEFAWGTELKAVDTVIVVPEMLEIDFVSRVPSDNMTDSVAESELTKSVLLESSTTICVVDTPVFILPPLLTPALLGSWLGNKINF